MSRFIQWLIHFWLNLTGRKVDVERFPFLNGPMGISSEIGDQFYKEVADQEGLEVREEEGGLLTDFREVLDPTSPHYDTLIPEIARFYEQTSQYSLEVWTKWIPPVSWLAHIIIRIVSVEMKQLNIPIDELDTSYGMTSKVIRLVEKNGTVRYTCWLRKSNKSDRVVYAGFYSGFQLEETSHKYVRVVFPLPKGNVTVVLRVELLPDGSVDLVSRGRGFGGIGYYRLHKNKRGILKARMIPIKESIHVFKDEEGTLRTDHIFSWWKRKFLHLHYKIIPRSKA
ncbi:MAG: hypothetical protein JJ975_00520 [Bacteroidia bacterium]|nr:hypothetical protein [Bacteroidia bacterium]